MMLCCQYSAKKPVKSGLPYKCNASFSICIFTGRQNVFTIKRLGIKLHAFKF